MNFVDTGAFEKAFANRNKPDFCRELIALLPGKNDTEKKKFLAAKLKVIRAFRNQNSYAERF